MEKVTNSVIDLFRMKIAAGVDALQIFDSAGAFCPADHYENMSLKWIKRIIAAMPEDFPIVIFAKGMAHQKSALTSTGARMLSVDWTIDLPSYYDSLPDNVAVQGNLDPLILSATGEITRRETLRLLEKMKGRHGHILNLGHGILPSAKPENMEILCQTVAEFGQG